MRTTWTNYLRRMAAVSAIGTSAMMASAESYAWAEAYDNAGNAPYADGWQDGDNGGSGFRPWASGYSGTGGLAHPAPKFIATTPLAGNSLGIPVFGLTTSNRGYYTDTSEVTRFFSHPLAVGTTFSADVDGPELFPAGFGFDYSVGATFQLCSGTSCSAGGERFGMFSNVSFNPNWTATSNNDTGIASSNSFHLEMTLVTPESFDLVLTPVGGGAPLFSLTNQALGGTAGEPITFFRATVYGTGSSADGTRELFFNNMSVVPEPGTGALLVLGAGVFASSTYRRRKE